MVPANMVEIKRQKIVIEPSVDPTASDQPDTLKSTAGSFRATFKTSHNQQMSNSRRHLRIEFITELVTDASGRRIYSLPLHDFANLLDFKLNIEILSSSRADGALPSIDSDPFRQIAFTTISVGQNMIHTAQFSSQHGIPYNLTLPKAGLTVSLPPSSPGPKIMVQKSPFKDEEGVHYFCIREKATTVRAAQFSSMRNRIAIFWDASLSRSFTSRQSEIHLIEELLTTATSSSMKIDALVDVYVIRDGVAERKEFAVGRENLASSVTNFLASIFYHGGTRIDQLRLFEEHNVRLILLVSDGRITLGGQLPPNPSFQNVVPINVITRRSDNPNSYILRFYSTLTGGQYFDLDEHSTLGIVESLLNPPVSLFASPSSDPIFQVHTSISYSPQSEGPHYLITGRTSKTGGLAKLEASCQLEGTITESKIYFIDTSSALDTGILPLIWAQRQLSHLLADPIRCEKMITDTSIRFGLETPLTKLEFLESDEDFLQFDAPPAPERMMALQAYLTKKIQQAQAKSAEEDTQIFNTEKKWSWLSEFRLDGPKLASRIQEPIKEKSSWSFKRPTAPRLVPSGDEGTNIRGLIRCATWSVDSVYVKTLLDPALTTIDTIRAAYVNLLPQFNAQPSFYYDFAYLLFSKNETQFARHVLCNILELGIPSAHLYRSMAYMFEAHGMHDIALELYDKVYQLSPNNSNAKRDLALALIKAGSRFFSRANTLLQSAILTPPMTANDIDVTAVLDWNALQTQAQRYGVSLVSDPRITQHFKKDIQADIRICVSWDTEKRDIDLYVQEPDGFVVYHGDRESPKRGIIPFEVQGEYGPEQYIQLSAEVGTYTFWTHLIADASDHPLLGPTTLFVKIYFDWGRSTQREFTRSIRVLQTTKNLVLGTIHVHLSSSNTMESATFTPGGIMPSRSPTIAPIATAAVLKSLSGRAGLMSSGISEAMMGLGMTPVDSAVGNKSSSGVGLSHVVGLGIAANKTLINPGPARAVVSPRASTKVAATSPPSPRSPIRHQESLLSNSTEVSSPGSAKTAGFFSLRESMGKDPIRSIDSLISQLKLASSQEIVPPASANTIATAAATAVGDGGWASSSPPQSTPPQGRSNNNDDAFKAFSGQGATLKQAKSSRRLADSDEARGISGAAIQYAVENVAQGIDPSNLEEGKKENCTTM